MNLRALSLLSAGLLQKKKSIVRNLGNLQLLVDLNEPSWDGTTSRLVFTFPNILDNLLLGCKNT